MSKAVNDVGTLEPLLKKVYPGESPGYEKQKKPRKRRFSKIRTTLKNKAKQRKSIPK